MKISKKDTLNWFRFFAMLPEEEELLPRQREIAESAIEQIERAVEKKFDALLKDIPSLRSLDGRTYFVGPEDRFPRGCKCCLTGSGLTAIRKTNRCNAACPFCYDYGCLDCQPAIGDGYWEIGGTRFREEDIPLLLVSQKKPDGVAYVYLEPFMEIEKYYGVINVFHSFGVYQHLYTNGISATEDELKRLGEAGLDEIRFNLGASRTSGSVIDKIAIAKKYIPRVGVETPMTPEFYDALMAKKERLLATGLDFMNLAELHLNDNNIVNYEGEPLYMSRKGYISPISSRTLTLQAMAVAARENWNVVLHDCSNRTKYARQLNLKAHEGGWFGSVDWACEFEQLPWRIFLPTLEDESLAFVEEEPLPAGYRPGDIVL